MKIMIVCSYAFYDKIEPIETELKKMGYQTILPNGYKDIGFIVKHREDDDFADWIASLRRKSEQIIKDIDALLVLNYTKKEVDYYIGGSTFLEIYDAFRMGKKIFIINPIPEGILTDEVIGMKPVILNGDLSIIRQNL